MKKLYPRVWFLIKKCY